MNQQERRKTHRLGAIALIVLAVGVMFALTGMALAGRPLTTDDFAPASAQGFGDRANGWAWSMQWWNGYLYVGTNHNWRCGEVLSQARNSFGIIPYPGEDPDVICPEDPLQLDLRAEIWRWHAETDTWERVFQSDNEVFTEFTQLGGSISNPVTVTVEISPTDVARDIGYRGMALFTEPDGTEALYVTAVSPAYLGYRIPPRILRSVDGVNFEPVPAEPGTPLAEIQKTSLRNPTVHVGTDGVARLYVQAGSSKGSGAIFESADPAQGNYAWRKVSPLDMKFSHVASYNGALYMGVRDPNAGFGVIRMYTDGGPLPYDFDFVMEDGGYSPSDQPNVEVLSLEEFQGRLYVGGNGIIVGFIPSLNTAAEIFRINPDNTWDLVAGEPRLVLPDDAPPKYPLSGYGAGFDNPNNGHIWRMLAHDDYLYITTFDGSIAAKDEPDIPPDVLEAMGFDLWRTGDGVNYQPVTTDGFSALVDDPNPPRPDLNLGAFDSGGRNMADTPYGFFLGTANYYYGLRLYRAFLGTPPDEVVISGASTAAISTTYVFTATTTPITTTLTEPLTYEWEATDLNSVTQSGDLQDNVSFAWQTPGVKVVTATVSNEYGSAVETFAVNVIEAQPDFGLTGLSVRAPRVGVTNSPVQIQAEVTPLNAAQPVQYFWQATGQANQNHTNGVRDLATFTWDTSGTKEVTVIADNGLSSFPQTLWVDISNCQPLVNLRMPLVPDTPLVPGSTARLEANTYGGTPPFQYEWWVNGERAGINDRRLEYPLLDPGMHTVKLTVSNSCSQKTVSRSLLVAEPLAPQADMSSARLFPSLTLVDNGDVIAYTIQLWNTSDTTTTLRLANPIPDYTEYVPNSARSSDDSGVLVRENVALWTGDVISGTPIIVSFSVTVTEDITRTGASIINQTYLEDVDTGNVSVLETSSRYAPGYSLVIEGDSPLYTRSRFVDLQYGWNSADNVAEVRFSNHAGFGSEPGANTSVWIPVNPDNPTFDNWALDDSGDLRTARTVYAIFRNSNGNIIGRIASAYKILDDGLPEIFNTEIIPQSPFSQLVNLRITAEDDISGIRSIVVGSDPELSDGQRFPFAGPVYDVPWTLPPSGIVYFRAQDRAGNYSDPITMVAGPEAVPLESVNMAIGPSSGSIGQYYSFFVEAGPYSVTHPIEYTWEATDQLSTTHVSGQSDLIQYRWLTAGTKVITFTATNVLSSAMNTHVIVIGQATPTPTPTPTNTPAPTSTPTATPPPPAMGHTMFMPIFFGSSAAPFMKGAAALPAGSALVGEQQARPKTATTPLTWPAGNPAGSGVPAALTPWITLLLLLMPGGAYLVVGRRAHDERLLRERLAEREPVAPGRPRSQVATENQPQKFSSHNQAAI